jgi:hypothetical protein
MRRHNFLIAILAVGWPLLGNLNKATAACTLPYQLTNGQNADATQVMANFNALVACLGSAGSTNAVQYNAGGGAFGGVGPLTNGQLVVGATGGAPQAQTLTPGAGISITNGAGNVTIAATGGQAGTGLYRQVMSATPTSASTGLTNWLNQGSATVDDSVVGVSMTLPPAGAGTHITGRFMASPTAPYKITALIAATRNSNSVNQVGIGWYDGSNKLHLLAYATNNGGAPYLFVGKFNSATSFNTIDVQTNINAFAQPIWLQIQDDGTNVPFSFSQDGANFLQLLSVAKASGWLGASGYNDVIFWSDPANAQTIGTVMSWAQN